jgi:SurA-like N-terminal domain
MRRDPVVLRTSITVTAAVLAVLAGVTGCGTIQMGSAAIVGSQGISSATLTSQVNDLTAAYHHSNGAIQLQFPLAQAPQQVLAWLVRFRIRDEMAARNHITVTRADTEAVQAAINAQARANHTSTAGLLVANGLPPDLLPQLSRYQAIELALVRKLNGGRFPTAQAALASLGRQFNAAQCRAAKSLAIRINPQFGRLDYGQLTVVPAVSGLSAPPGGAASPSAAPQLTPPC